MKKVLFLMTLAVAQAVGAQQLANTTFDGTWENCYPWEKGAKVTTAYGTQPSGWCVSNVPNSAMPLVASEQTGASGTGKSVKLTNVAVMGQNAPGYITLGTTWATAEVKLLTNVRNADGGVFGGIAFTYHPDAVRLTYKCDRSAGSENMSVIAYLWKGTWRQEDVPSNTAVGTFTKYGTADKVPMIDRIQNILNKSCNTGGAITCTDDAELIASVEYYSNTAVNTWTTQEFPLEYQSSAVPEKLNIVVASNGLFDDRSTIKSDNSVTIDDVELVYWHALSTLSFEGATLSFNENTTSYDLSSVEYDEAKLSYLIKGQAATASTTYNDETAVLTIRVEGEDFASNSESFTEYTIQFKVPVVGPEVIYRKTYPEDLYVTVAGDTGGKQVADVLVETLDNGHINFILKNFVLGECEDAMAVGNIAVNDIKVEADGSFGFEGGIEIAEGDVPAPTEDGWSGPDITAWCGGSVPINLSGQFIGENKVVVYITINITSVLGPAGDVEVHLGYDAAPMKVNAEAQYGTFCAPFAVTIPDGVEAYTVPSVVDGLLTLTDLSETIPANTPVILFAENGYYNTGEEDEVLPIYVFGIAEEGTPTVGVLTGVYEDTPAPIVEGKVTYVLQNLEKVGFYKVVSGSQPTVGANHCYLTISSSSDVREAYFFNEDDATGINAIENGQQITDNGVIFNLAGQRISKMQKGINIINGKKVLK